MCVCMWGARGWGWGGGGGQEESVCMFVIVGVSIKNNKKIYKSTGLLNPRQLQIDT